jgi:hypothetical protein
MNWVKAERRSGKFLKELDADDFYDQLDIIGSYLKQLTSAFGKTASRQWGRARDVAIDSAHDAEGAMKDNLAASLIIAVGLGVVIGYMFGRSSE